MARNPFLIFLAATAVLLIAAEARWSWKQQRQAYDWRETFTNLALLIGRQVTKKLLFGYQLALISLATSYAWPRLPANGLTFAAAFLLTDFIYYWHHRLMHQSRLLWAFHVVHHSGTHLNLTTNFRLSWLSGLVAVFLYLPLLWLGFPPRILLGCLALAGLYQFTLHTQAIGKLARLEGWLNTPSAHRVHHAANERYLDKNFGGMLMIWDRLFGTYEPETERPRYGIPTGFVSYNPFKLNWHGFAEWARSFRNMAQDKVTVR